MREVYIIFMYRINQFFKLHIVMDCKVHSKVTQSSLSYSWLKGRSHLFATSFAVSLRYIARRGTYSAVQQGEHTQY